VATSDAVELGGRVGGCVWGGVKGDRLVGLASERKNVYLGKGE
jgi:hypothetical protein